MAIFKSSDEHHLGFKKTAREDLINIDLYRLDVGRLYANPDGEKKAILQMWVPFGAETWFSKRGRKIPPKKGGGYLYETPFSVGTDCKLIVCTPIPLKRDRFKQIKTDPQETMTVKEFLDWLDPDRQWDPAEEDDPFPSEPYKKRDPGYRETINKSEMRMIGKSMDGVDEADILPELKPEDAMSDSAAARSEEVGGGAADEDEVGAGGKQKTGKKKGGKGRGGKKKTGKAGKK